MKFSLEKNAIKKHITKLIMGATIVVSFFVGNTVRALAGDINGEEARVIAAASGTFYYDNEAYAAKPEYISQLTGYLAQDGVDLSASQADAAISEMYASIEQGVTSGYLYKLSETEEETTEESTTEEETTEEETTEDGISDGSNAKPPIMVIPKSDTTESVTESPDAADTATEETTGAHENVIDQPVDESHATGKISYDTESHTIIYEDKEGTEKKELPSIRHPLDVSKYVNIGNVLVFTILAIILLAIAGLYLGKCFPWQKKKRNRKTAKYYVNHKMRSTYRKICGHTFAALIGAHVLAFILLVGVGVSIFRQSFVLDNLTSSGYYRYIYDDMNMTIQRELKEYDSEAVGQLLNNVGYDMFLTASKKQAKGNLNGKETQYDGAALSDKLMGIECGLTDQEQQTCVNVIVGNMQSYSADMVGSSIYGIKQGYSDFEQHAVPIMLINIVLMVLVVILMDRYHHRGVRYIARGVIGGAALAAVCTVILYVAKPFAKIYMQPASLYLFIRDYMQHAIIIVGAIACIMILVGVVLMALVGVIRKKQMEND